MDFVYGLFFFFFFCIVSANKTNAFPASSPFHWKLHSQMAFSPFFSPYWHGLDQLLNAVYHQERSKWSCCVPQVILLCISCHERFSISDHDGNSIVIFFLVIVPQSHIVPLQWQSTMRLQFTWSHCICRMITQNKGLVNDSEWRRDICKHLLQCSIYIYSLCMQLMPQCHLWNHGCAAKGYQPDRSSAEWHLTFAASSISW